MGFEGSNQTSNVSPFAHIEGELPSGQATWKFHAVKRPGVPVIRQFGDSEDLRYIHSWVETVSDHRFSR